MAKPFTTEPKLRRFLKNGAFISSKRAAMFMEHLWELKLRDASYETLVFEFIQFFGSNDKRTVERYLGRPERCVSAGQAKVVKMNRQSGKIAQFEYLNERRIPAKKGLLEILGYITPYKEGYETRFRINHELMPYYTVQTTLSEREARTAVNRQEVKERSEASKDDLCVRSISQSPSLTESEGVRGKGFGENPILATAVRGESVSPMGLSPSIEEGEAEGGVNKKEEEEEDNKSTHTNLLWKSQTRIQNCIQKAWIEEVDKFFKVLAEAKPLDSEPDKAKVKWK